MLRPTSPPWLAVVVLATFVHNTYGQQLTDTERRNPQPTVSYALGAESSVQESVPQGKLEGPFLFHSEAIADTVRKYWIYVPQQYDPQEPACLLVFQDGARAINPDGVLRVPTVLDNLIAKQQIPVTIGVFITPGQRGDEFPDEIGTGNPNNRDREYDVLDDTYARFLIDELLPEISKDYALTKDPAGRAIGGASSGAICAFTVAWHRPDEFRNVVSLIGSYTNIHGGHVYPELVRESDPKPIRIFLQDGENDLRNAENPDRDWFLQNQKMVAALEAQGYDLAYVFGKGGHSDDHGGAILPLMLRWIWRDYPGVESPQTDLVAAARSIQPEVVELFPGFDAEAEVDPSGTYVWESRFGRSNATYRLTIHQNQGDLSGKLESTRNDEPADTVEISNPVMQGNKLIFEVTSRFRDREFTSTYQAIVSDSGLSGWRMMDFGGQSRDSSWSAEKASAKTPE